jgi:transcriptional regulator with PAS, ATPase and Fis domain
MGEPFDGMIGDCAAMRQVFAVLERLAPSELTVLVLGETGTGKELAARSLHGRSGRAAGPFVAVNCAALPLGLVESELFGFEKGAFTGAVAAHPGLVERADGGTLFLDEIAELPLEVQSKLLRVVQDRRVQRVGGGREHHVDARLVAATHQDLPGLVEAGGFRRDLYHRVNEATVTLPPLRDRGDDLEHLTDAIVERTVRATGRAVRLTPAARAALRAHGWPGNVRELENVLRRAVTFAAAGVIDANDLQLEPVAPARTLAEIVDAATEGAVRAALRRHAGDAAGAARELGIPAAELRRLAARFHVGLEATP